MNRTVLLSCWILAALLVVIFTPRGKIRKALVIFLFTHAVTWLFGLIVAELKLIEYPIREFAYATKSSFAFEYFIYPATCVIFILRFPHTKGWMNKVGWYLIWPTWMSIVEVLIERYTELIRYLDWTGLWSWITLLVTFSMSHLFYLWFYRK
ncbi:CBO0543 family protein [Paenibacillus silviterrae]|uniref:CBO0543 family protein n=1 Tax=Paenibacillus silviterrae TaxID=3242194 RepID=UPI0025436008|nr:CBO0543 family protein [Paenibacillus chinjuensis]